MSRSTRATGELRADAAGALATLKAAVKRWEEQTKGLSNPRGGDLAFDLATLCGHLEERLKR